MTFKKTLLATLIATPLALTGCSDEPQSKAPEAEAQAPASAPAAQATPATDPHAGLSVPLRLAGNEGRVLKVENAGGYTYIEVDQNGRNLWLAGTQTQLQVGDIVSWGQASILRNFTSKSLNRNFDEIYFVTTFQPMRNVGNLRTAAPVASNNSGADSGTQGKVLSSQNSGGYSYLEVQTSQGTKWVAVPQGAFKQGDEVSWQGAALMRNFTSSSLGRTFDEIFFAGSVSKLR